MQLPEIGHPKRGEGEENAPSPGDASTPMAVEVPIV